MRRKKTHFFSFFSCFNTSSGARVWRYNMMRALVCYLVLLTGLVMAQSTFFIPFQVSNSGISGGTISKFSLRFKLNYCTTKNKSADVIKLIHGLLEIGYQIKTRQKFCWNTLVVQLTEVHSILCEQIFDIINIFAKLSMVCFNWTFVII